MRNCWKLYEIIGLNVNRSIIYNILLVSAAVSDVLKYSIPSPLLHRPMGTNPLDSSTWSVDIFIYNLDLDTV